MGVTEAFDPASSSVSARYEANFLEGATHPEVIAFVDYWCSCARGALPSRADFEPRRIARWLPYFFVMELKQGRVHYRLVGTRLEARAGTVAQGRFVGEIFSPQATKEGLALFQRTVDARAPIVMQLRLTGLPVEFLEFEAVQAPIFAPDGKDIWLVGCMYPTDEQSGPTSTFR